MNEKNLENESEQGCSEHIDAGTPMTEKVLGAWCLVLGLKKDDNTREDD